MTSLPLQYREAVVADIAAMKYIRDTVVENALTSMRIEIADYMQALFVDGKGWVCLDGNKLVGFGCAQLVQKDIWALFIAQEYEGRGIGNTLMGLLETWLFAQGCDRIELSTGRGTRAEALYRRRNWQCVLAPDVAELTFYLTSTSRSS